MAAPVSTRIVVLGGGVGGMAAARHLERLFRDRADTEIVLVSRDNLFLLSPLLFEACSGARRTGATLPRSSGRTKLSEMPLQGDLWQEEQGEPSNL